MNYREKINTLLDKQEAKGLSKYGCTLEDNPAELLERLQHLAEELADGLNYIMWIMDKVEDSHSTHKPGSGVCCTDNCKRRGRAVLWR